MKFKHWLSPALLAAILSTHSYGGTISYVAIPPSGSDAQSGISADSVYTSAVDGGNSTGAGRVVNGVTLQPLSGTGTSVTVNGITLNALTGSLANNGTTASTVKVDGALADVLSDTTYNPGAEDNSSQEIVIDPATLTQGQTYDLRIYICNGSGQNRSVNLAFAGDKQAAVETGFFNEDDATSSPGGFSDPNQAYYINYRYSWDGATTPGVTITQKLGGMPFQLYAATNQQVAAAVATVRHPGRRVAEEAVAEGPTDVGVASEDFYTSPSLRDHGRWVEVEGYGNCWQPNDVDSDWRPYTRGRWVHSENEGYTWASDEDFGWATYHYGRWARVHDAGWCWVPGRVWAPAWVSWRSNDSYEGWAPLPPVAAFSVSIGISRWADHSYDIGPDQYNFVPVRDFGSPRLAEAIVPRDQNVTIVQNTTNITNIVNRNQTVYNGGPNIQTVNNAITRGGGQPVPTVVIDRRQSAAPGGNGRLSQLTGNKFSLAAPAVIAAARPASVPVAQSFKAAAIDHGWSGVKDPNAASALKAKLAKEAQSASPPPLAKLAVPPAAAHPAAVLPNPAPVKGPAHPATAAAMHPGQSLKGGPPKIVTATPGGSPASAKAAAGKHPGQPASAQVPGVAPAQPLATAPAGTHPGEAVHPGQGVKPPETTVPAATSKLHGKHPGQPAATPPPLTPQAESEVKHPGQSTNPPETAVPAGTPKLHGKHPGQPAGTPPPLTPQAETGAIRPSQASELAPPAPAATPHAKHPGQSIKAPSEVAPKAPVAPEPGPAATPVKHGSHPAKEPDPPPQPEGSRRQGSEIAT